MSTATVRLAVGSPIVTAGAPWADVGSIEESGPNRRDGRPSRLPPPHVQRARRRCRLRSSPAAGATYWDPLATFGYLAARTERIRFATHVLVLGYHHPLEIAKRYGTLDLVSDGRLILGVGVGTLKEEFDLIGAPFDDRGPRADDALRALRASLSARVPAYHGAVLRLRGARRRSVRRAGARADLGRRPDAALAAARGHARRRLGPFAVAPVQAAEWLQRVDVPSGFEVVLPPTARLDPINEPTKTQEILGETAALGATIILSGFASESLEHYLELLESLAAIHAKV